MQVSKLTPYQLAVAKNLLQLKPSDEANVLQGTHSRFEGYDLDFLHYLIPKEGFADAPMECETKFQAQLQESYRKFLSELGLQIDKPLSYNDYQRLVFNKKFRDEEMIVKFIITPILAYKSYKDDSDLLIDIERFKTMVSQVRPSSHKLSSSTNSCNVLLIRLADVIEKSNGKYTDKAFELLFELALITNRLKPEAADFDKQVKLFEPDIKSIDPPKNRNLPNAILGYISKVCLDVAKLMSQNGLYAGFYELFQSATAFATNLNSKNSQNLLNGFASKLFGLMATVRDVHMHSRIDLNFDKSFDDFEATLTHLFALLQLHVPGSLGLGFVDKLKTYMLKIRKEKLSSN